MLRTQNANLYFQHTFLMLSVVGNSFCWEITRYQQKLGFLAQTQL